MRWVVMMEIKRGVGMSFKEGSIKRRMQWQKGTEETKGKMAFLPPEVVCSQTINRSRRLGDGIRWDGCRCWWLRRGREDPGGSVGGASPCATLALG